MSARHGRGLLHLAAAVDRAVPPDGGAEPCVDAVRLAERGGLDFVTLGDDPARPGPDALTVLTRAAAATRRIGLVPVLAAPHPGPCRVPAAVAALDRVSGGRAGQLVRLPGPPGTGPGAGESEDRQDDRCTRATRHIRATRDTRAARDGRPPEADGQDQEGGGVPSATGPDVPPSPQGGPVRMVDAEDPARCPAARHADVVLVRAAGAEQAGAARDRLRAAARQAGRDPDSLRVLVRLGVDLGDGEYAADRGWASDPFARGRTLGAGTGRRRPAAPGPLYRGGPVDLAGLIAAWYRGGAADGFLLVPREPVRDLERLVNGTVAVLQHRGLFRTFYPGSTLREHLGLARPALTRHPVRPPGHPWKG
jgi:alkanesulfonate monooxygenase SsuD/methylene tetrahydromethanopterin reductase-like flavin-dependent oxidoreductase (luciferase family)